MPITASICFSSN